MELISPAIILFIGFCQFYLCHADEHKFPDNGRLEVGKCLSENLAWKTDEIEELQDNLFKFCVETKLKPEHIQTEIKEKKMDLHEVTNKISQCLEANPITDLIERYVNFVPLEEYKKLPIINQVVVGLCQEREVVEFAKLDQEDKPKVVRCLQKCAENLFRKFEKQYNYLEAIFEERRNNGEIPVKLIDDDEDDDDDESSKEPNVPTQEMLTNFKPKLGKNVQQYINKCNEKEITDISTLDSIGGTYASSYIGDLDQLYEICPVEEKKQQIFASVESYFACVRWLCAMKEREDCPAGETLSDVIRRKSEDDNDLVKNQQSVER